LETDLLVVFCDLDSQPSRHSAGNIVVPNMWGPFNAAQKLESCTFCILALWFSNMIPYDTIAQYFMSCPTPLLAILVSILAIARHPEVGPRVIYQYYKDVTVTVRSIFKALDCPPP
jgi:hypothetical protein